MSLQDPHYKAILDGLAGPGLDPIKFEHCACDLLRRGDKWPNLICMPGGNDHGQDGGATTREGDPVRLICTTSQDVIGNFTGSLRQLSPEITRVILATSQKLTHQQIRNLEERALELNRRLIHPPYAREAIADRLFYNSRWSFELLGIDGRPAALSALPRSSRPLFDLPPIGRGEDLAWLTQTPGDLILVGQPGSGKTHLLRRLTADPEARAFFVVDRDRTALANALRDLQPKVVIVDDAFEDPAFLRGLRELRGASGFSIIAATWPYRLRELRVELGEVPDHHVRQLEGMTRRELAELYRSAGVDAREDILVELVRQARNKPGLAASLIWSWRASDYARIANGESLMTSLAPALWVISGNDSPGLLGALGLGGRRGVPLGSAAHFLSVSVAEAHRICRDLSASGILEVRANEALAVVPEELATALLISAFLGPPAMPGWQLFAESLEDKNAVLDALLRAAEAGASLDPELLSSWILRFGNPDSRQRFAALSEAHAELAVRSFPEHYLELIPVMLELRPRETIRRLLNLPPEIPPEREWLDVFLGDSLPPTPLELIGEWLAQGHPNKEFAASRAIERKSILLEEIERFLRRGGDRHVAAEALLLVSGSVLRHTERTLDGLRMGLMVLPAEPQIATQSWKSLLGISGDLGGNFWVYCQQLLDGMTEAFRRAGSEHVGESWQGLARRVIEDLGRETAPFSVEASRLKVAAGNLEVPLELATDPVLDGLLDWHVTHREAVRRIVVETQDLESGEQADRLLRYAAVASESQNPGGKVATAARQLASGASDPLRWLDVWSARGVPKSWVGPLLENIASREPAGWEQRLGDLLHHQAYAAPAAAALLNHGELRTELLENALAVLRQHPYETFRLADAPVEVVRRLLIEEGPISQWVLENEWVRQGGPRPELVAEWEGAASRASFDGLFLEEILKQRPHLIRRWLLRYAARSEAPSEPFPFSFLELISRLEEPVRLEALAALNPEGADVGLIKGLVGTSPSVYRALLRRPEMENLAPAPLAFLPDRDWATLATVALEETALGEGDVVAAAFAAVTVFDPRDIQVWQQFRPAFESLVEIPGMARLAARGIAEAEIRISEAQEHQRRFEMTGSPFAFR